MYDIEKYLSLRISTNLYIYIDAYDTFIFVTSVSTEIRLE